MKKIFIILIVVICLALIIAGFYAYKNQNTSQNPSQKYTETINNGSTNKVNDLTQKPPINSESTNVADCGTSTIFKKTLDINNASLTGDKALACMGNKIIGGCAKGNMILVMVSSGSLEYSIVGKQDNNCLIKIQYGSAEQIPVAEQKKYAGSWLQCPVSVQEITSQSKDLATIGLSAYFNAAMPKSFGSNGVKYKDGCEGTFLDIK